MLGARAKVTLAIRPRADPAKRRTPDKRPGVRRTGHLARKVQRSAVTQTRYQASEAFRGNAFRGNVMDNETSTVRSGEQEVADLLEAAFDTLGDSAERLDALLARIGNGPLRNELFFAHTALVTARLAILARWPRLYGEGGERVRSCRADGSVPLCSSTRITQ
jgi:hypothetical protein